MSPPTPLHPPYPYTTLFRSPFQDAVIPAILSGKHLIILAPTAGGKTEAALFPVLSRLLSENWTGLSVLYICPIKALLNNLDRKSTRLNSSHRCISYAVFCLN